MFEVINRCELAHSGDHIWRILSDLPKYRDWHPTSFFNGTASLNAAIDYGFKGTLASMHEPSTPARIVSFKPGETIGWRLGIPGFMWADEWYRLTSLGKVTIVEHGLRCSGPFSWVMKSVVSKRIGPIFEAASDALKIYARTQPRLCPHCGRTHLENRQQRRKSGQSRIKR